MEEAVSPHISIDRDAVTAFCRRHHIKRLALFGSVLRDDFRPDSDVDVLVEFEPGHVPGLDFVTIEREFSGLLQGRRVEPGDRRGRAAGFAGVLQRPSERPMGGHHRDAPQGRARLSWH